MGVKIDIGCPHGTMQIEVDLAHEDVTVLTTTYDQPCECHLTDAALAALKEAIVRELIHYHAQRN